MSEHPLNSKSFTALNAQLNTNPRGRVSFKWTELYNSSVLVSFFLALRSDLAYVRWFATVIRYTFFYWKWPDTPRSYSLVFVNGQLMLNLRGGVLSKCTKCCNSSVKLALFLDRRSKLACVWCSVSVITITVFMENERTPFKLQVFYGTKCSTQYKSTWSRFMEMCNSSVLVSFFLALRLDLAYVRWFATVIRNTFFYWKWPDTPRSYSLVFVNGQLMLNLRGGVLSKCTKCCNSSVKLALFLDRRSKLCSVQYAIQWFMIA